MLDLIHSPHYTSRCGAAYHGDARDLIRAVPDASVQLILTSPPFPLAHPKEYGNVGAAEYVDWFLPFAREFLRVLTPEGSLVLDLGGTYLPRRPVRSLYQYELITRLCREEVGFRLAQEIYHYNPARLPSPAEWVNVRRIRVKDAVNPVWWLARSDNPKADNRRVLQPYSKSMRGLLQRGCTPQQRPSGWALTTKFAKDNGGAIPPNLLSIAHTESNSPYLRRCKAAGIKPHPARFPAAFAAFFVNFLTAEGDVVLDPFAGSNTTGSVAEELGRRWLAFELREDYVRGSRLRFAAAA